MEKRNGLLSRLARNLASNGETEARWRTAAYGLAISVVLLFGLCLVVPQVEREFTRLNASEPTVPLNYEAWRDLYENPYSGLLENCITDPRCPANPESDLAQTRGIRVGAERNERVPLLEGKVFWSIADIPAADVEKALAEKANGFLIGYLFGTYDIFIDGHRARHGDQKNARDLVSFQIASERYSPGRALRIAIRLTHDMGEPFPISLYRTGFHTAQQLETMARLNDWEWKTKTAAAAGFCFGLGSLFLAFWLCSPRKRELGAFAAFAFLHATIQFSLHPVIWHNVGGYNWQQLNFIMSCYESVAILALGFSLARIRSSIAFFAFSLLFAAPWIVYALNLKSIEYFFLSISVSRVANIVAYAIAGLLCFSQARLVAREAIDELHDPGRIKKLRASWVMLAVMCAVHAWGIVNSQDMRIYNVALLALLAAMIVYDYQRQEILVRRAPMSKYHQRATLPERVACVMVALDLKRSEGLFRFGADRGLGGSFVHEIIERFYRKVTQAGGEVIQTEGDSMIFFLERGKGADSLATAIKVVRELERELKSEISKASSLHGAEFPAEVGLRAAIDEGEVKPVWQQLGGRQIPGWAQVGRSNVMLEVARLLDAETKVAARHESLLVAPEGLASLAPETFHRSMRVPTKHGRELAIKVMDLGEQVSSAA